MNYIPTKPIEFKVKPGAGHEVSIEAYSGDIEREELALAFEALRDALGRLHFAIVRERHSADERPSLLVRFPLSRQWEWRSADAVLKEEPAGGIEDTFQLVEHRGATWGLRWEHKSVTTDVVGDAPSVPSNELFSDDSVPVLKLQSLRLESGDGGHLLLSGRLMCSNAPPLGRELDVQVTCSGVDAEGKIDAEGRLHALLQPLPTRPAKMRQSVALPVSIGSTRVSIDTGDVLVQTRFRGAEVAVAEDPRPEFSETIPAGHLPLLIRFKSSAYLPAETALAFASPQGRFPFRMQEKEVGTYRLIDGEASITRLIDDRLEVQLESQRGDPAGMIAVVPETLRGHWFASGEKLEWTPVRELREHHIPPPDPADANRPQRVDYAGKSLAVDPTAFDALVLKDPLAALGADVIPFVRASPKETYVAVQPDRVSSLGTLIKTEKAKYALPENARMALRKGAPVVIQNTEGTEQALLWNPHAVPQSDSYQRISTVAVEAAEDRAALVVFRGICARVAVRKVAAIGTGAEHWMIELATPLASPRDLLVEPFLPLMMRLDGTPPSQIALWQFGKPETLLEIRGDGLPVGERVGYVFRRRSDKTAPYEWVGIPPLQEETEILYCSWNGFLISSNLAAAEVRFGGWFLPFGELVYPARPPFDSYRFSRRRKAAEGRIKATTSAAGDGWTWLESLRVPEEDRSVVIERVRARYPSVPRSDADPFDAREHDVLVGTRHYVLRPSWSLKEEALVIAVVEQLPAKSSDSVALFAEKKKS